MSDDTFSIFRTMSVAEERERKLAMLNAMNLRLLTKINLMQAGVDAARGKCLAIIHNPQRSRDATLVRSILSALDGEVKECPVCHGEALLEQYNCPRCHRRPTTVR